MDVSKAIKDFDEKSSAAHSFNGRGVRAVLASTVDAYPGPEEVLHALIFLTDGRHLLPEQVTVAIFRLARTLMEHGLTGWQSPSSEDPA